MGWLAIWTLARPGSWWVLRLFQSFVSTRWVCMCDLATLGVTRTVACGHPTVPPAPTSAAQPTMHTRRAYLGAFAPLYIRNQCHQLGQSGPPVGIISRSHWFIPRHSMHGRPRPLLLGA